jgi:hypothetical protein
MAKPKTTEKFIEQSIKMHGNKYDYSMVKYVGNLIDVCIICPKHGEFLQKPNCHLQQAGCPKCAIERRTNTQDQIISDFILAHGSKYDYSKVKYRILEEKVCIICPDHGEFWQEPGSHKRGVGCPECYEARRAKTQEEFILQAIKVHGNKYDYSKVKYVDNKSKICIICPVHGEFFQVAGNHIQVASGCLKCSIYNKRITTDKFIKEARAMHGDKYDYSKVNYIRRSDKVCIICPKHGEFWQIAVNHINGHRCFKCSQIVLKDGTVCGSQLEAYMCLRHQDEGVYFLHNHLYGKELGNMRYDFYFPSLNLYEEVTSYDFRPGYSAGIEKKIKDFYLEKIEKKRKFVENKGGTFKFIELRLTRPQQVYVFANSIQ